VRQTEVTPRHSSVRWRIVRQRCCKGNRGNRAIRFIVDEHLFLTAQRLAPTQSFRHQLTRGCSGLSFSRRRIVQILANMIFEDVRTVLNVQEIAGR
jgi:hypothetical protein